MDDVDKVIERVDHATPGPGERALFIWELFRKEHPDLTDWDLVCFASNYLGYISPAFPWLHDSARAICSLVYKAHYLNGDKLDTASAIRRDASVLPESSGDTRSDGAGESEGNSIEPVIEGS